MAGIFRQFAIALIVLGGLGASAQSFAADKNSFVGPYIGGTVGYQRYKEKLDLGGAEIASNKVDEYDYGGVVGWRTGLSTNLLFGVEGFAQFTDAQIVEGAFAVDVERTLGVGAYIGHPVNPRMLVFAGVYYTNTRLRPKFDWTGTGSDQLSGTRVGGGFELGFTPQISIRADVYYTDYENYEFLVIDPTLGLLSLQIKPAKAHAGASVLWSF